MKFFDALSPAVLRPYALSRPRIEREGVCRDMTMPARDWGRYEAPAYERKEFIRRYSGVKR
jgi:hypothetical protein